MNIHDLLISDRQLKSRVKSYAILVDKKIKAISILAQPQMYFRKIHKN